MNVRRRQEGGNREVGSPSRNVNTKRVDGPSQAKPITNAHTKPSPQGPATVRNAVNGPKP